MIFLTEPILLININIFDINIAHVTINDIKLIEKLSFLSEIIINISKTRKERIYNICIRKIILLFIIGFSVLKILFIKFIISSIDISKNIELITNDIIKINFFLFPLKHLFILK